MSNYIALFLAAQRLVSQRQLIAQGEALAHPLPRLSVQYARLESAFAKIFYTDTQTRGILKAICDKHRSDFDDLGQELLSALLKGFSNQKISLTQAPTFYSYVYRVAEVLAFKAHHQTKAAHTDSLDANNVGGQGQNNEAYFAHSDEGSQILAFEQQLDQERSGARARIEQKRLAAMRAAANAQAAIKAHNIDRNKIEPWLNIAPRRHVESNNNDANRAETNSADASSIKLSKAKPKQSKKNNDSNKSDKPTQLAEPQRVSGAPPRSKDQQRLYEAWQKSMLPQIDFAAELGTNKGRLQSYFSARTSGVPAALMAALDFFESRHQHNIAQLNTLFGDGLPMPDILNRWLAQLQTPGSSHSATKAYLSLVLNVHRSTISRWESDQLRPSASALAGYERNVQQSAASLAKQQHLAASSQ